jgi:hypothetical protein
LKTFVLGGVVHKGPPHAIDVQSLRDKMRIQKSVNEIKLTHVAKGEFLHLLASKKLGTFLRWIHDHGFFIHYRELDPMYWSTVDIIDSILYGLNTSYFNEHHMLLKNGLFSILQRDLRTTIRLFYNYDYPGLSAENRKPFIQELSHLIDQHIHTLPQINGKVLNMVINGARSLDSLPFIEGELPNLLIKDFSTFYINRVVLFKNSHHILDMEETIKPCFLELPLVDGGRPLQNYRFSDSKSEAGIQIADVVTGLMGKFHTYLNSTSKAELTGTRAGLGHIERNNVALLRDLITASREENRAFLDHITCLDNFAKVDLFLQFKNGAYHEISH